jgi:chemotaxis protein histidine kinase CheA
MNRIFLVSIVGLGALSAAGIAGSRAHTAAVAYASEAQSAPVVLVTSPDGKCAVATNVSALVCDPQSKGSDTPHVYTLSVKGDGSGACASTGGVATVTSRGGNVAAISDGSEHRLTLDRLFAARGAEGQEVTVVHAPPPAGQDEQARKVLLERLAHVDEHDADVETLRYALAGAGQDPDSDEWRRHTAEARLSEARARKIHAEAVEQYLDAIRAAERTLQERRAEPGRAPRRALRAEWLTGLSGQSPAQGGALESRVEALEKAARGRGLEVDSNRSLEERVAELEQHMQTTRPRAERWMLTPPTEPTPTTPEPRTWRLNRTAPTPPPAPVAPLAPLAPESPRFTPPPAPAPEHVAPLVRRRSSLGTTSPAPRALDPLNGADREDVTRAMDELKREAARLREELTRMRAEVDRLPRTDGMR